MHLNELEALTSTNTDDITQAAEILSKSTGNTVLITLGKQGVHLFENGTHALVSSKQATVVDTIGAGDSTSVLSLPCEQWGTLFWKQSPRKSDCRESSQCQRSYHYNRRI